MARRCARPHSKITTGNPAEDFKIVNEPVRGDIYISVPDGFTKPNLSFFGTTRKGFVYKFLRQVRGNDAEQVFVTNTAVKAEAARDWDVRSSPEDTAVRLAHRRGRRRCRCPEPDRSFAGRAAHQWPRALGLRQRAAAHDQYRGLPGQRRRAATSRARRSTSSCSG